MVPIRAQYGPARLLGTAPGDKGPLFWQRNKRNIVMEPGFLESNLTHSQQTQGRRTMAIQTNSKRGGKTISRKMGAESKIPGSSVSQTLIKTCFHRERKREAITALLPPATPNPSYAPDSGKYFQPLHFNFEKTL